MGGHLAAPKARPVTTQNETNQNASWLEDSGKQSFDISPVDDNDLSGMKDTDPAIQEQSQDICQISTMQLHSRQTCHETKFKPMTQ